MLRATEPAMRELWPNDAGSQNIWRAWANGQANIIAHQLDDRTEFVRSLSTVKPDDNTGNYLRNVRAIAGNHAEYARINALMNYYINQKTIVQGV